MENQYKRAARLLDKLYEEMPEGSFTNESVVRARFKKFQKMFSVDKLASFEGNDVLNYIFDFKSDDSLLYTLVYKEEYGEFGSIKGAGVDFYPIYRTKDGGWNTKEKGEKKRINYERAIQIGRTYKNKLANALRKIETIPFRTIEDYEAFERILYQNIGDDAKYIWVHKYLHLLYPDLFSEFHGWDFKKHFLCAMQIKPRETFYGMAGQIAEIRRNMKMQDYYRIAYTVYHFFPEVGDGGICRLCLTSKGIKKAASWLAGTYEKMGFPDFDRLSGNRWFKSAEQKNHHYLFVVTDSDNKLYGTFKDVEVVPVDDPRKSVIEKQGIWNPCFRITDRIPVPDDGINTNDRTFSNSKNLIFIYSRFYNCFTDNDELEKIFRENRQQLEEEESVFEVRRKSFTTTYRIVVQELSELEPEKIIYGYPGSLLTMLYDGLKSYDMVRGPKLCDIGNIYKNRDRLWYEKNIFESDDAAYESLKKNLILFLAFCVENKSYNLQEFSTSPLSEDLKIKLLSAYHPDKYIGISNADDLNDILEYLEIPSSKQDEWMKKQLLLINWKNTHMPFSGQNVTNYVFLRTVCTWLGIPFSQSDSQSVTFQTNKTSGENPVYDNQKAEKSHKKSSQTDKQPSERDVVESQQKSPSTDRAEPEKESESEGTLIPVADPVTVRENEIEESVEQLVLAEAAVNTEENFVYEGAPQKKKAFEEVSPRKIIPRDIQKKKNALLHAGYKCEFDKNHKSFICRSTGLPYMEAHHLIPIEYYDNFDVSIDIEENIVSLCSNCHREIHHGEEAAEIVKKLFNERNLYLRKAGINISLDQLLMWYGVKDPDIHRT